jgi:hypothetical protein
MELTESALAVTHLMHQTVHLVEGIQLETPLVGELLSDALNCLGGLIPLKIIVPSRSLLVL